MTEQTAQPRSEIEDNSRNVVAQRVKKGGRPPV
jgi:hypothetical protein